MALIAVTLAFASTLAHADDLTWRCALKPQDSSVIECSETAADDATRVALRTDPLPASYSADLLAPGQARNITRLVRTAPDQYAGRTWSIPLVSPLIDAQRGRELARSVMCGREPGCALELTPP